MVCDAYRVVLFCLLHACRLLAVLTPSIVAPLCSSTGTSSVKNATSGPSECTPCKLGFYSGQGAADCTVLTSASLLIASSDTRVWDRILLFLQPCDAGTHANRTGTSLCASCELGRSSNKQAVNCALCSPGTFADNAKLASPCKPCAPGEYTARTGTEQCSKCPAGTQVRAEATVSDRRARRALVQFLFVRFRAESSVGLQPLQQLHAWLLRGQRGNRAVLAVPHRHLRSVSVLCTWLVRPLLILPCLLRPRPRMCPCVQLQRQQGVHAVPRRPRQQPPGRHRLPGLPARPCDLHHWPGACVC